MSKSSKEALKRIFTNVGDLLSNTLSNRRKVRLQELHFAYEYRHDPVYEWVPASDTPPSNDRLVQCQVWTNLPDGGMLKEFGVPLYYRSVDNIATWWTKDNRSFNGWVTYWRDYHG